MRFGLWAGMACTFVGLAASQVMPVSAGQSDRPNILFLIADDMGIDASPCYPGREPKARMPNLERLCARGIVYDKVWTYALCSPTRAALTTGRYGFRTGIGFVIDPQAPADMALSEKEVSLHRLLASAPDPYAVAHIGKWHLAQRAIAENHPAKMGVAHFDGYLSGAPAPGYGQWNRTVNGKSARSTEYMTSAFTNAAIDWIGRQNRPWLMWLAYSAPHTPYHVPPSHLHSRTDLTSAAEAARENPLPHFHAMLEALDTEIGRLLASLAPDVAANTLVIFLGDNGSAREVYRGDADGGRSKATLYQGGIAVPLIVAGAGVTRQGERDDTLVDATDLFATIADVASVPVAHSIDGRSFKGTFSTAGSAAPKLAYSELFGSWLRGPRRQSLGWTVRDERYKFIQWEQGSSALFDLVEDPNETRNLLAGPSSPVIAERAARLRMANAALKRL